MAKVQRINDNSKCFNDYFPKNTEIFLLVLSGLVRNLLVLEWEIKKKQKPRENHPGCPSAKQQNFLIGYGWVAHCGLKIGAPIAPLYFSMSCPRKGFFPL